jgi:hypothetical protein
MPDLEGMYAGVPSPITRIRYFRITFPGGKHWNFETLSAAKRVARKHHITEVIELVDGWTEVKRHQVALTTVLPPFATIARLTFSFVIERIHENSEERLRALSFVHAVERDGEYLHVTIDYHQALRLYGQTLRPGDPEGELGMRIKRIEMSLRNMVWSKE